MDRAVTLVSGSRVHRPILDENLSPDDIRVSREELNETPETREVALRVLKKMLLDQTDFTPRTDDVYLLRFLRVRKFDCEKAFKTIRDCYKFRKANPDMFVLPSAVERVLRAGIFNFLPHRDHKGRVVYVVKADRWDPDILSSYSEYLAAGNLVAEYVLDNAVTQINGYIGIFDFKGFSWKHFLQVCTPKNIVTLCQLMQDRFPGRFKIAYCVNCHSLVNTAWNLFKPIVREKFRNRVKILGRDITALHQYVDKSILPAEYGGPQPALDHEDMAERTLATETYVNYNQKFGF